MGNILKIQKFTTLFEGIIVTVGIGLVLGLVYFFAPGLRVGEGKILDALNLDNNKIDNVSHAAMIELPSSTPSTIVGSQPMIKIAGYAWNGNSALLASMGGPQTMKGSLMEKNGVNVSFEREDMVGELKNRQLKFIEEFDKGIAFPKSDKSAMGVVIMGDGAPFYISTMQKVLDEKFGKDKYHLEVVGAYGASYGEDKLIGPKKWKDNPKTMLGSLITVVIGDGDWVTILNYCFANGLKVNPDFTTYDPEAVNFVPSENDDYIKSAEELIKSQKSGYTVPLDVVKNGKKTGDKINKQIDGCGTWTPGDKMVFDALTGFTDIASTKDFVNQMPTTLIVVKEWAAKNPEIVTNILKSALTAGNQMKLYDEWRVRASEAVAKTFKLQTPNYWYNMFKGQVGEKAGLPYSVGGTRALNYADALQYYGVGGDNVSRYKSVYDQVSRYLVELNPFDFNNQVDNVTTYDAAVNLRYLKNIEDIESGVVEVTDYSKEATNVVASGEWRFQFATGSDKILPTSNKELEKLYNLLVQAEATKLVIEGHSDNTGSDEINRPLSEKRANAVVDYLTSRGINSSRIQLITGYGSEKPISDNTTEAGRAKNRRVQVTLLQ